MQTSAFVEQLLALGNAMLAAAQQGEWAELQRLAEEREQLIASPAGQQPAQPGSQAQWREVERLNAAALELAESQLQQLADGLQSSNNVQKLQKRYSP